MKKKVAISGIQSSGKLHLGNYFGAIKQFVEFQETYDMYVSVVNLHSLTTMRNPDELRGFTRDVIIDYLAAGLDPEKSVIFLQSDIPEVTELAWIFECLVTVPYLERAHAYKDKVQKKIEPTVGLFTYPMLMAADILIVGGEIVPVGEDQRQHVEIAREIARKFNQTYGSTFAEPEEYIKKDVAVVPGIDGEKMSKSYNNTIPLFGTDADIKSQIAKIVTDSKTPEEPKNPEECNVFALHKLITPEPELTEIKKRYVEGGIGYKESKDILLKNVLAFVSPMRERREALLANPAEIDRVLEEGKRKVRRIVEEKMADIRKKIGIL